MFQHRGRRSQIFAILGSAVVALMSFPLMSLPVTAASASSVESAAHHVVALPDTMPCNPNISSSQPCTISVGPDQVTTCLIESATPVHHGSGDGQTITGTGYILSCTSPPEACSVQSDLQEYDTKYGAWITVAVGPTNYECPPPSQSSTATYKCETQSENYEYWTLTIATVTEGGELGTDDVFSNSVNYKCL